MQLVQGYVYHLKDEFFDLIDNKYLMSNKENNGFRPHFCAIADMKNKDIFWMIPISSQYDKYKKIYDDKINKFGRCDTIVFGEFVNKERTFLIQNAFPIISKYINHIHTYNNVPLILSRNLILKLQNKLKRCLRLYQKGKNVFFTDIENIYKVLDTH